jgi:rhodanese-related sulfurtransferase
MNDAINTIQGDKAMSIITLEELRESMAGGEHPILAEVLPATHYASGHLPGAAHLPLESLETVARTVCPNSTASIVVYCASTTCSNSEVAARRLTALGYTHVRVFRGGKAAWSDAGLVLAVGAS